MPLSAMKRPDMIFKKVNGLQCIRNGCTATTTILERKNMTVKELYSILDKESTRDWAIMVYADDGKSYEVAYTSKDYGIDSKIGIMQEYPYTMREVFDREVISYYICANSIIAKVEMWDELKEKVLQMEKNKEKQLKVYRMHPILCTMAMNRQRLYIYKLHWICSGQSQKKIISHVTDWKNWQLNLRMDCLKIIKKKL